MLDWRHVYDVALRESSRQRLINTAVQLQGRNARISYSGFAETARWLDAELHGRGLDARLESYPADGRTRVAGRVMPQAWDVDGGELEIVGADGRAERIASYDACPYSVVMFSAATEGVVEAPLSYFAPKQAHGYMAWRKEDLDGADIEGRCVFFEVRPDAVLLRLLREGGAVGFITDGYGPRSAHHRCQPQATRWINDAFGEGLVTASIPTLPGFSIPPAVGGELRKRLEGGEKPRARFRVDSRRFDGTFDFVRGALPGATRPQERVFLLAHLFEPNVSNDCNGVSINAEALSVLRRLIGSGELPAPARTIELFAGWEMWGIAAYAAENPDVRHNGVAGIGVDVIANRDSRRGRERIEWFAASDANPSFVSGWIATLLRHFSERSGLEAEERRGFTGNDNMLSDPTLGPGTAFVEGSQQMTDGYYHTDADTPDKLDPERMAHVAATVAAGAYMIACATEPEAAWLADQAYLRGRGRIEELVRAAGEGEVDCPVERMRALTAVETSAIASVRALSDGDPVEDRVRTLGRRLEASAAMEMEKLGPAPEEAEAPSHDEALWGEAERLIPVRVIPGPVTLQESSAEVREAFERETGLPIEKMEWYGGTPDLFWADGRRSLAEVHKLSRLDRPTLRDDAALSSMMKLYRFLDRQGLLELRTV